MRDQEWDSTFSELYSLDLSKLVFSLSSLNSVYGESTLGIVDKSEMFTSLLNCDNIHVSSWVVDVGSDLVIDFDESLHNDGLHLTTVESICHYVSALC